MISIKKIIADSVDKMHKGMEYEDNLSESFVEERFHNLYIKSCISYNYHHVIIVKLLLYINWWCYWVSTEFSWCRQKQHECTEQPHKKP